VQLSIPSEADGSSFGQSLYPLDYPKFLYHVHKRQSVERVNCIQSTTSHSISLTSILTLNIPSLARQRCLSSWGPGRTPWFFCNFSTVWCGRLLKLCFFRFL